MNIQTKTLTIIISCFVILALLLALTLNEIITKSYLKIEKNNVRSDLQRTVNLIKIKQDNLKLMATDWAVWDDSYEFINNPGQKYIDSNLPDSTFTDSNLSFIVYVKKNGKVVYGSAFDGDLEKQVPLPQSLLPHLQVDNVILKSHDSGNSISGFISLSEGLFFISSIPILTSNAEGPSPGVLIMGRRFDQQSVKQLSENLKLDVSIFLPEKLSPQIENIARQLNAETKFLVKQESESSILGYSMFSSIYSAPSFLLKINIPRPVYLQGKKALFLIFISIFIGMLVLIVLVYFLLQKFILNRLSELSSEVEKIQSNGNRKPICKIKDDGNNDEIDILAQNINKMLSTIYSSNIELEKAKNIAEKSSVVKSEFISMINHELRTPLHVVIGYSELLERTELDEEQKKYVKSIQSGGSSLLNIISDVLDFSKTEAGRLEINKTEVNLLLIIKEVKNMFEKSLLNKGLYFDVTISDMLPEYIIMDEYRLKQILLNLLSNAVKFTEVGGVKLVIEVSPSKKYRCVNITFQVTDTGIGIPEINHEKIFEQFFQQEGQDNRKYGGTGLGLAISNKIALLLNGNISLSSRVNKGSVFTLSLNDVEVKTEIPGNKYQDGQNDIQLKSMVMLIADDIKENRELIKNYLQGYSIKFIEAENGTQAVELAIKYTPALILMDIKMPEMDGVEATKRIKKESVLVNIPIIAVSAASIAGENSQQNEALFDDFLPKPLSSKLLKKILEKYIGINTLVNSD